MQPIGTLVSFVERCEARIGIALDLATAAKAKGVSVADAIETASEHLVTVRVPVDGAGIPWAQTITTLQKVGYEGPFIVDASGPSALVRARKTREHLEPMNP
jgi:predicted alpha-1,6-mannanase (GH76 family)